MGTLWCDFVCVYIFKLIVIGWVILKVKQNTKIEPQYYDSMSYIIVTKSNKEKSEKSNQCFT